MACPIGMDVVVGLFECQWLWVCASPRMTDCPRLTFFDALWGMSKEVGDIVCGLSGFVSLFSMWQSYPWWRCGSNGSIPHGGVVIAVICVIGEASVYRVFRAFVWKGLQSEFFKFAAFKTRLMSSPPLDSPEPSVRFMLLWVSVGWRMCSAAQCLWWRWGWRFLVKMSLVLSELATPPIRMLFSM